jgi:hypothetical protein
MAQSTDVNLPREHRARFPNRCVVCGCESPTSKARVITGSLGWWTWIFWWWGMPFMVKVPTCRSCGWRFQTRRLVGMLIAFAVVTVVYFWVWPLLQDVVPKGLKRWTIMGLAIACMLPFVFFEIFFAPSFQVTAYSENVDYEFADCDYAIDFATLNRHAAWVKINGNFVPFDEDS